MMDVLLAVRDLTFGYDPDRPVLRNVNLELRRGDRLALIGRNGAGKSTLLHLLVGLNRPQAGHIEAWGQACRCEADFRAVRRRAALLFQNSEDQLFCPTVLEDVAFGPLNLGCSAAEARRVALEALAVVGMPDYGERVTHHLSAGEMKRIALAAILSMQPTVLLLDEPTAGLDEAATEQVVSILNRLDVSLLVVAQDPAFLARVTRRKLVLRDGATVA